MSYVRVIPRDLFNEANLLKCLGQLYIKLESISSRNAAFQVEDAECFEIMQSEADGSITCSTLPFAIKGELWRLSRPLNSRQPWPLYASDLDDTRTVPVFDEDGNLSDEFITLIR